MMDRNPGHSYICETLNLGFRIDKKEILIPSEVLEGWQSLVNTVAEIISVPAALIMKVDSPYIEVFCSSESKGNPYKAGDREHLDGLYCEKVIKTRDKLLIPNASKDSEWAKNPDIESGMLSYLGFPILWPDGEVFGTICVLDSKENEYEERYEKLMAHFKGLVETHLVLLFRNVADSKNFEGILDSVKEGIIAHDTKRRILFFNRAAEDITGYGREDAIGRDCHEVFGSPFCGGRCSFCGGPRDLWEDKEYPLNILTKDRKPRRIEMSVTEMKDADGRFSGVLAAFRDVTDLVGLRIQHGELKGFAGLVGRDRKMLQVYRQIRDLAVTNYPVYISGETGTGKEMVASAIHNESRRGGMPFVPVNCAALPEGMLESELFGHVKGAFTGAVRDKKGRFELAHKGTMFLDEVADLHKAMQAKLLRVLQDGIFERVGGEKPVAVDVRIISASNKNIKREVERRNFRDDLYYRISVFPIHLPPLRDRKKDVPLLVEHFLEEAMKDGAKTAGVSKDALGVLTDYPWPGNVRELQSTIRFAIVKSRGRVIRIKDLPMELQNLKESLRSRGPSRKLDSESVRDALAQAGGNKAKAARLLGVGRATLYRFLADFPDLS